MSSNELASIKKPPEGGFDVETYVLDRFVLELLTTQGGFIHQTAFGNRKHW